MADFKLLAETVVNNSTTNTVTMSNIPQVASHLRIVLQAKTNRTGGDTGVIRLNNDTGSNYNYQRSFTAHYMDGAFGDGFSTNAYTNQGEIYTVMIPSNAYAPSVVTYAPYFIDIANYTSTTSPKLGMIWFGSAMLTTSSGYSDNTGSITFAYNSASPLTSITFVASVSESTIYYNQNARFSIYGIK